MIPFLDLKKINDPYQHDINLSIKKVISSGNYILGQEVKGFENEFATFCKSKYCIGVSNGLDALCLILESFIVQGRLKEGDEILVPANTYIATVLAILNKNLKPIFIEPDTKTFNICPIDIQKKITDNTKAILVVHLYGQLCDINAIEKISKQEGLIVIEDAAQAHGASHKNISAGNFLMLEPLVFTLEKILVAWEMEARSQQIVKKQLLLSIYSEIMAHM